MKQVTETMTPAPDGVGILDESTWVTAWMPRSLAVASLKAAGSNGTSRSAIIRGALEKYIDDFGEKSDGRA